MRYPNGRFQEGFYTKTVTSTDTRLGTFALVSTECDDLNSLLRHIAAFRDAYGYLPRPVRVGPNTDKWAWEGRTRSGDRTTDVVWASRID